MRKIKFLIVLFFIHSALLFALDKLDPVKIQIEWNPDSENSTYCNIGFRARDGEVPLTSSAVTMIPEYSPSGLLGVIDNLEIFWMIYSKNEGMNLTLSLSGPLVGTKNDQIHWSVCLSDDESKNATSNGSQSFVVDELSGSENGYYEGSEGIVIRTIENAATKRPDNYTGEVTLAIVSD